MDTCDALFLEAPAAGPLAQIYAQDLLFYFLDLSVSPLLPSRSYNRALYNVRFRKIKGTPNGLSPLYFPALCVAVEGRNGKVEMLRHEHQLSVLRALAEFVSL